MAVAGVAVAGLAAARLPEPARTPVLGAIAGLGYAVLAVAARILPGFSPGQLIRDPATYALAAAGIVSFMLYATALDGGSVTVATAAVVLAETAPPAVVGVLFLGDHDPARADGSPSLGFVLAVICAVRAGPVRRGRARTVTPASVAACRSAGRRAEHLDGVLSGRPSSTRRRACKRADLYAKAVYLGVGQGRGGPCVSGRQGLRGLIS